MLGLSAVKLAGRSSHFFFLCQGKCTLEILMVFSVQPKIFGKEWKMCGIWAFVTNVKLVT